MSNNSFSVEYLGIGSAETWRGSSELRVQSCNIISTDEHLIEDLVDDDEEIINAIPARGATLQPVDFQAARAHSLESTVSLESFVTDTSFEGKKIRKHLSQLVATCVVCSYTENNLNRKLGKNLTSAIPTILFNAESFRVCIYDCREDVLLISEPRTLLTDCQQQLA